MTPRILISYRRADSAAIVGRIYDRLVARYGPGTVFLDIDSIPFATDFRDQVRDTLKKSDVVLAVVGPHWRGPDDDHPRILDEKDNVGIEIEMALLAHIPIFPVLVDGARMPAADQLPEKIASFAFLNAAPVDSGRDFHHHMDELTASIDRMLGIPPPSQAASRPGVARFLRSPFPWTAAALLALPLGANLLALGPPWPPGAGPLAGVAAAFTFALVHERFRALRPATWNRVAIASSVIFVAAVFTYLTATSVYVYQTPGKERFVKGFACTGEAMLVYKGKCPNLGMDEIRNAEYEPETLWTSQSIALVRLLLDALWLLVFIALGALAAAVPVSRASPELSSALRNRRTRT
jgi:TIR domain